MGCKGTNPLLFSHHQDKLQDAQHPHEASCKRSSDYFSQPPTTTGSKRTPQSLSPWILDCTILSALNTRYFFPWYPYFQLSSSHKMRALFQLPVGSFQSSQASISSFDKKSWSSPPTKARMPRTCSPNRRTGRRKCLIDISRSYLVSHALRTHLKVNKTALPYCD